MKKLKVQTNNGAVFKHKYKAQWYDTHCHLDKTLPRIKLPHRPKGYQLNQFPAFVEEQCFGNFGGCVAISCSADSLHTMQAMTQWYSTNGAYEKLYVAFGCHPHYSKQWTPSFREQTIHALQRIENGRVVAVGEAGLDYYRLLADAETQKRVFIDQINISRDLNLPLVVHSRQAEEDTIEIMKEHCDKQQFIHLHCFTDSMKMADVLLNAFPNLYIGFTGVITFDSAQHNRELVRDVPLERMLLETDAPFMAPLPHRGKVSHCGYIPLIAETVGAVKQIDDIEFVLQTCTDNAKRVYNL